LIKNNSHCSAGLDEEPCATIWRFLAAVERFGEPG